MCSIFGLLYRYLGVGSEYYRWVQSQSEDTTKADGSSSGQSTASFDNIRRETEKLNSVATFFMKKSFKNVR